MRGDGSTWRPGSNKWASEPKFERRVASVRAAFRKID
jgi:hypothetical protein